MLRDGAEERLDWTYPYLLLPCKHDDHLHGVHVPDELGDIGGSTDPLLRQLLHFQHLHTIH